MNKRLQQFLSAENISQSQFADTLGVARASISHILAGRNKPGFDFIESMARHYPALNLEWLITGKGRMYKDNSKSVAAANDNLFPDEESVPEEPVDDSDIAEIMPINSSNAFDNNIQPINNKRSIAKIIVFYDDNTFQELK